MLAANSLSYLDFLAPGIVSMSIMFSSAFVGISIIWDRQFGFLQEVIVASVSRLSIVIGRTIGGNNCPDTGLYNFTYFLTLGG